MTAVLMQSFNILKLLFKYQWSSGVIGVGARVLLAVGRRHEAVAGSQARSAGLSWRRTEVLRAGMPLAGQWCTSTDGLSVRPLSECSLLKHSHMLLPGLHLAGELWAEFGGVSV